MLNVNTTIKNAYNQSTTQTDRIKLNGNYYYITNVSYKDDCYNEGNIFGTAIARILTFDIDSSVSLENKEFQYETGILRNGSPLYINLGNFIVTDTQEGDTDEITKVTALDYMLKTNTKYTTNLNYSQATLLDVLQEVCVNCGLTLATNSFTNSNFRVDSNQFDADTLNRQVIQAIAQISGCVAKIKADNKLYLINPNQVSQVSQIFTLKEYSEADIKRLTHPINLVSLADSQIEGENITMRDESSILENGENSIIIKDNPFAYTQEKRLQLITPLFNAIKGFEYKSYAFNFQMLPYIETLDKIQFKDKAGNTYNSYVFRFDYKSPNGLDSTIEAPSLTKATINYQNVPSALDLAKRTEILVDKQNQVIESVVSNVNSQNNKISRVEQTVDEINSKISDIAEITTSQETLTGRLTFEDINQSEPISVTIRPLSENISYLYPFPTLYPANNLYIKLRTLRFTNTTTNEVFDYDLPDDLLYYDSEHYDEFKLDYESLTCYVNKKCKYDSNGNVVLLASEVVKSFDFPHIELTDGNYKVEILKYDNTPYQAYLFVRLMAANYYTTQFATKAELHSEISQTTDSINLSVDQKLTNYSTTSEMSSAINLKANEITSTVSENYSTKTETENAKNEAISEAGTDTDTKLQNYSTTVQMNSAINQKANEISSTVNETYITKTDSANNIATAKTQAINSANASTDQKLINYSTTQQMNSAITQKANEINSSVSSTYITKTDSATNINTAKTQAINSANASTDTKLQSYSTTTQMNSAINQKANEITSTVSSTYSTKTETTNAINNISVGGRNYLLNTKRTITNSNYAIAQYNLTEVPVDNEEYTFSLKGTLGTGKTNFRIYNSGGSVQLATLVYDSEKDIYKATFNWKTNSASNTYVRVYVFNQSTVVNSTIEWVKLEKGNKATDYSPAPEDLTNYTDTQISYAKSEIKQTTDSISLEVEGKLDETDFTSANILLAINNDTSSAKIKADKISLQRKTNKFDK